MHKVFSERFCTANRSHQTATPRAAYLYEFSVIIRKLTSDYGAIETAPVLWK